MSAEQIVRGRIDSDGRLVEAEPRLMALHRAAGGEEQGQLAVPQIASLAGRHFRIEKQTAGDLARTTVERLEDDLVLDELCRMLGADAKDAGARKHAEELLAAA